MLWQIAADAERIHVVEEERAVPAQQVLHVVFRCGQQNVHAGIVHQAIEPCGIERDGGRFHGSKHMRLLGAGVVLPAILGETNPCVIPQTADRA
jgi:hypothetical protein